MLPSFTWLWGKWQIVDAYVEYVAERQMQSFSPSYRTAISTWQIIVWGHMSLTAAASGGSTGAWLSDSYTSFTDWYAWIWGQSWTETNIILVYDDSNALNASEIAMELQKCFMTILKYEKQSPDSIKTCRCLQCDVINVMVDNCTASYMLRKHLKHLATLVLEGATEIK